MKKKSLIIVLAIVAILIVLVVCIGLKGCSSSEKKEGTDVNQNSTVLDDNKEKDDVDEETDQEAASDDVADWGDATEGVVGEETTKPSTSGKQPSTSDKQPSTQGNNSDNETQKTYTITYNVNNANATIEVTTQKVAYGETFTLATPKLKGGDDQRFVKWVITGTNEQFESGTYTLEKDVSLTAIWEENYSKNY